LASHVFAHSVGRSTGLREQFPEDLCDQQRNQQKALKEEFAGFWMGDLRSNLGQILAKDPDKRPVSFAEAAKIATLPGGVLWGIGQLLYAKISKTSPSEEEIRAFIQACPPFRAACYALSMAWYEGSLRETPVSPERNDLMMAMYLPYSGRFVTNDTQGKGKDGGQEMRLSEIATAAQIPCEVTSFVAFTNGMLVSV
jgi:hypothetical protein